MKLDDFYLEVNLLTRDWNWNVWSWLITDSSLTMGTERITLGSSGLLLFALGLGTGGEDSVEDKGLFWALGLLEGGDDLVEGGGTGSRSTGGRPGTATLFQTFWFGWRLSSSRPVLPYLILVLYLISEGLSGCLSW